MSPAAAGEAQALAAAEEEEEASDSAGKQVEGLEEAAGKLFAWGGSCWRLDPARCGQRPSCSQLGAAGQTLPPAPEQPQPREQGLGPGKVPATSQHRAVSKAGEAGGLIFPEQMSEA